MIQMPGKSAKGTLQREIAFAQLVNKANKANIDLSIYSCLTIDIYMTNGPLRVTIMTKAFVMMF